MAVDRLSMQFYSSLHPRRPHVQGIQFYLGNPGLTPSVVHILTEISGMGSFNQAVPSQGVGTGIVLDKQGNILTNNHVIAGAQSITVTLIHFAHTSPELGVVLVGAVIPNGRGLAPLRDQEQ